MADAVQVFSPGFRVTDSSIGAPLSGAIIRFFDAGTSTPKTVYADSDLLVALGTTVTTDALGYPTSNGTTKTLVYLGTALYKLTIETSAAVQIASHDNVKGAFAAGTGGSSGSATYATIVETKSLNYTVLAGDQSKILLGNCSSGDVTYTLPSAITVGAGWRLRAEHAGTANQLKLATVSSQTIRRGRTSFGVAYAFSTNGEGGTLVSDGGNWVLTDYSKAALPPDTGVFTIADRLSAPPGAPADGAIYLLTAAPSGAWSTFAQHDLAQWTGTAWIKFTPVSNCGWLAFVQVENRYYRFQASAWASEIATDTAPGTIEYADQSEMEGATSGFAVPPHRQHFHPGHPKVWGNVRVNSGTPSLNASYNMTSINDTGVGTMTVVIATDFSSTSWACIVAAENSLTNNAVSLYIDPGSQLAGQFGLRFRDPDSVEDPNAYHWVGLGDQ